MDLNKLNLFEDFEPLPPPDPATGCCRFNIFQALRWEFIKENKKTRNRPGKRLRKQERKQEFDQESDQENKNSTKNQPRKKK